MKSCTLCGAEYSERISFCFNDGEVLVHAALGVVKAPKDPFDVPMPGNMPPTMPREDLADTPVPAETREDGIVSEQAPETPVRAGVLPPPAAAEPNDFTPRPLQPMAVGPKETGEPVYTPPVGIEVEPLDDEPAAVTPPPAKPSEPPPPRPAATPSPQASQERGSKSDMLVLLVAVVVVFVLSLMFGGVLLFSSATSTGALDGDGAAAVAERTEPVAAPVEEPAVVAPGEEGTEAEVAPDDGAPEAPPTDEGPVAEAAETEDRPLVEDAGAVQPAPSPVPSEEPSAPTEDSPWGAVAEVAPATVEPAEPEATTVEPVVRRIAFSSSPSGAEVIVNSQYRGNTPVTQALEDGEYEISMRMQGFVTQRKTVVVSASTSRLSMDLPRIAEASLTITAPGLEGGTIYIDGIPKGTVPKVVTVKPGSHIFLVELADGTKRKVTRDITMDDTTLVIQ